jgi:glutathione S-transferase
MSASGNTEVKLIGSWASPYVTRARIALNIKEVQYEFLEESFGTKSELLLKSNPVYKKVPVLIHDGKPVCESMIIVQYIDDVWTGSGPSLMPADAYERAMHRFWTVFVDDKVPKRSFVLSFTLIVFSFSGSATILHLYNKNHVRLFIRKVTLEEII